MKIKLYKSGKGQTNIERVRELIPFDVSFDVELTDFNPPFEFDYEKNGKKYYAIPVWWLEKHVRRDVDLNVFWFDKRKWGGKRSGGRAHHLVNGIPTISMTSTDGEKRLVAPDQYEDEFVARLVHEFSHIMYDDILKKPDTTHYWDYEKKNLLKVMDDWKDYTVQKKLVSALTTLVGLYQKLIERRKHGLRPELQEKADKLIEVAKLQGYDLRITSGYRSPAEQNRLYAQGRTTPGNIVTYARAGESAHNWRAAFDVVDRERGYTLNWNEIGEIGESLGLEWGGRWKSFPDRPHFELPNWREYVD